MEMIILLVWNPFLLPIEYLINSRLISESHRHPNPIEEFNPKDRYDRWDKLSSFSITSQFLVEPIWDHIIAYF